MITACLVAAAFAAAASTPSTIPSLSETEAATELAAARGFAGPGALTGTPDGKYLFAAEGAALTLIEPGGAKAPNDAPDKNFDQPIKKFELGSFRPHVVRMILDPEADLDDGTSLAVVGHPHYRNYLFVAAGPNGLWIVDADRAPGVTNRVSRVDDSDGNPKEQTSDRHCNDVEVLTLGNQTFVLGTFAAANDSQLRVYRIEDVRAVLGASKGNRSETGREIAPLLTVPLGASLSGTPFNSLNVGPNQIARSFASDLVVDQPDPASKEAFVYVAMRTDGVVRVRLRLGELLKGRSAIDAVHWGPRFGDQSYYANVAPEKGTTDNRAVYDNVRWINQQTEPDLVERSDPPYVTVLAVHREGEDRAGQKHGHKLYVGVDGLGIVVFDLADPEAWGQTMPIDHHEGAPIDLRGDGQLANPGAWEERLVGMGSAKDARSVRELIGYVRDMSVVDSPTGLKLVAMYTGNPSIGNSPRYLEGFAYEDQFQYGGVSYLTPMAGTRRGVTRVFEVAGFPQRSAEIRATRSVEFDEGGQALFVPEVQSNRLGGDAPERRLEVVHVGSTGVGMTSIEFGPSGAHTPITATRELALIPGRRTFGLQQSLVDPNLIMTSDNDGHPREGLMYLVGEPGDRSIAVDYDESAPGGNDQRLSTGVIMGRRSQWLDTRLGPNQQAVIGEGDPRPADPSSGVRALPSTHMVAIQTIPSTLGGSPEVSESRFNLVQLPDRWNRTGRAFYLGGMVDPRYDAWVQANVGGLEGAEYFFLFRQATPDGLVFGRRDALMDLLTSGTVEDGAYLTPAELSAAGVELRTLNTHPEFDGFPSHPTDTAYGAAAAWFGQPVVPHPYRDRVKTWEPEMIRVRPESGSASDAGWVLAAPSGVGVLGTSEHPDLDDVSLTPNRYRRLEEISVVEGDDTVVGDTAWLPDAGSEEALSLDRGLVLFWDFSDPSSIPVVPGKPDGSSSLPRIQLPIASEESSDPLDVGRSSFAWHLESLEVERGGELHSYTIVGDFIGGVHAYEVSRILDGVAPERRASWYPPASRQDVLTNNIRDVVVDRDADVPHVYVAIQRVGVVVLRADVDANGALQLTEVERIDDIKEPLTLHLRVVEETGERLLYVCDHRQAIRVYSSLASEAGRTTLVKRRRVEGRKKTIPARSAGMRSGAKTKRATVRPVRRQAKQKPD